MTLFEVQEDWRQAWKWFQTQLGLVIIAAPEVYSQVEGMQQYIPPASFRYLMMGLGVLVVYNSLRKKATA